MNSAMILNILLLITFYLPLKLQTNLGEIYLLKLQTITALLLIGLYALHSWRERVMVSPEPEVVRKYGRLIGEPRLDPTAGIISTAILADGKTCEILLQPKWWEFLGSSNINKNPQETTMVESPVGSVPVGKEPGSLVCLQNEEGKVVGMASRVKTGSGSVLLTAFHVLTEHREVYICKNKARVRMEPTWETEAWNASPEVDFIAIRVPVKVWSVLGVSSSPTKSLRGCVPVTCYGASSSSSFTSSSGTATYEKGFNIIHKASTLVGWSGSPLYCKGFVVGLHRSFRVPGVSNNATTIHVVLSTSESPLEDGGIREIDMEEGEFRTDFVEYTIGGRGTYAVGESEFYRKSDWVPKSGVYWADIVDEEDQEFFDSMETWRSDENLNEMRAVSACLPPYPVSVATSGVNQSPSGLTECPSLELDSRVCVLEKLVEQLTQSSSQMLELLSQNSRTLAGLSAEQLRSTTPSCSKQVGSNQPAPRLTYAKVVKLSSPNIPVPEPEKSSVETPGTKKRSRRRHKPSVNDSSTNSHPQASPSQS